MKNWFVILVIQLITGLAFAQEPPKPRDPEPITPQEIIYDYVDEPAEFPGGTKALLQFIQDQVRELVVRTLTKEARSVKDGMDISLACFNHKTNTLQWTGANNPLWIFRGEEVLITNPDKQPVGQFDGSKPFTTHEIQVETNDWIILFSDGYADQFGGPKNKKYKYATLKDFILAHKDKSGAELKLDLKTEFENWKGLNEQTDDVCLMGIKLV